MTWTKSTTTKHTHDVVFGRKVDFCPRCEELKAGAAPVKWNIDRKRINDQVLAQEIRNHNCSKSGCGPICTFGQW